jgi:glyoxylase-like metal-dependent hydrolase (beta-lactamase superfamily II)
MFQLDRLRVHVIAESYSRVDAGGAFGLVPAVLWKKTYPPHIDVSDHRVPMVQTTLLIETEDRRIVVDTGHGDWLSDKARAIIAHTQPRGTLRNSLARLGIAPDAVTDVINTHLHGDHCAGNITQPGVPTFPNARYWVCARELDDALHPNERTRATYLLEPYAPLLASGQMQPLTLEGDVPHPIAPGVSVVSMPGHTAGHMGVMIGRERAQLVFVCDMATFAVHFERLGWMTAYDVEPLVTLETKRRWHRWAAEAPEPPVFIFGHDTHRPAGRLVGGAIEPVAVEYV